jgi:hypothetical protein
VHPLEITATRSGASRRLLRTAVPPAVSATPRPRSPSSSGHERPRSSGAATTPFSDTGGSTSVSSAKLVVLEQRDLGESPARLRGERDAEAPDLVSARRSWRVASMVETRSSSNTSRPHDQDAELELKRSQGVQPCPVAAAQLEADSRISSSRSLGTCTARSSLLRPMARTGESPTDAPLATSASSSPTMV